MPLTIDGKQRARPKDAVPRGHEATGRCAEADAPGLTAAVALPERRRGSRSPAPAADLTPGDEPQHTSRSGGRAGHRRRAPRQRPTADRPPTSRRPAEDAHARARRRDLLLRGREGSRPRGADRLYFVEVQPFDRSFTQVDARRRRCGRRRTAARRDLAAAEGDPRRHLESHQGARREDIELSRRAAAARQRADARGAAAHARRSGAHAREPRARPSAHGRRRADPDVRDRTSSRPPTR